MQGQLQRHVAATKSCVAYTSGMCSQEHGSNKVTLCIHTQKCTCSSDILCLLLLLDVLATHLLCENCTTFCSCNLSLQHVPNFITPPE